MRSRDECSRSGRTPTATTVLVTGANRGIGLELCRALKQRGTHVIAVCRESSPQLDALGAQVETRIDVTDSKAALNAAGMSLAHDLRGRGIAVVTLHPGYVKTDMTGGTGGIEPSESARMLLERIDARLRGGRHV